MVAIMEDYMKQFGGLSLKELNELYNETQNSVEKLGAQLFLGTPNGDVSSEYFKQSKKAKAILEIINKRYL